MSKINTDNIKARLSDKMKKGDDIITGGVLRQGLADRIKRKMKNAAITATIVITLLGPAVPRAIASSTDLKPKIEYVEKEGAQLQTVKIWQLINEIDRLFEESSKDWNQLKQKIDQLYNIGKKLEDADTIIKADDYMRRYLLYYALDFVGEGKFTKAFSMLNEYIDISKRRHRKDWEKDGEYTIKLIKDMIGSEETASISLTTIPSQGAGAHHNLQSYISIDTINTFFIVKNVCTSSLPENMAREMTVSEAKKFLREKYGLKEYLQDKNIIIEYSRSGIQHTVIAKVLVDIR